MTHFQSHATPVASALLSVALLSACAVVETGASVVKATAAVASATVGVAATVVGTTVVAGSAAVSAASAAKSVTVAAVGTAVAATGAAVAAGSLVVVGVQAINNASRENDVAMTSVVATAPDRFSASDGRKWITRNCAGVVAGQPALWVALRSGENEIRVNAGTRCPVLAVE